MRTYLIEVDDETAEALDLLEVSRGVKAEHLARAMVEGTTVSCIEQGPGEVVECYVERAHLLASGEKYTDWEARPRSPWCPVKLLAKLRDTYGYLVAKRNKKPRPQPVLLSPETIGHLKQIEYLFAHEGDLGSLLEHFFDIHIENLATDSDILHMEVETRTWDNLPEARRVASRVAKHLGQRWSVKPSKEYPGRFFIVLNRRASSRKGGSK